MTFQKLLIFSNYVEAYSFRADTYYVKGDFQLAIEDYSKAIDISPNNEEFYFWRGRSKYNLNDYENAIIDFDKAIELNPKKVLFELRANAKYL